MIKFLKNIGPGAMVAAAFIGPGTITTASLAGAEYGQTLLWAIVFSILATIVLQEMTARLGIFTGQGLGENIRQKFQKPLLRRILAALVLAAILVGNAAYEAGNITGAMLGLGNILAETNTQNNRTWFIPIAIGIIVFFILNSNKKKTIEIVLTGLVTILSISFLTVLILLKPDFGTLLKSLFTIKFPENSTMMIISLIGTTIVPYNLFLHASSVSEKWKTPNDYKSAKWDTIISIVLGGIVTLAIATTSSIVYHSQNIKLNSLSDLSIQLEPLLGSKAQVFLALGFLCAGITSAITAPLAAAYATKGVLGWTVKNSNRRFRLVWGSVLIAGVLFSVLKFKPIPLILFAQFTNGLILPIMTFILIWLMNDQQILGIRKNNLIQNIMAVFIFFVTLLLGLKSILVVFKNVF